MANKQKLRPLWLKLHLYLGLSLGLLFVLLGITGSMLVFYPTLDSLLNPHIQASVPASPPSPQAILEKLRAIYPERSAGWRIEMPLHASDPVLARYLKPHEKQDRHFSPLMVTLDPHTLQVTSSRFWGDTVMTWIYDLHYSLLLDFKGKNLVAIASMFILLSLISGLYLWWPRNHHFRSALTYRRHAHLYRRVYDWHKLSGLYGAILLLMLTLTGIMLERPDWFEDWLGARTGMLHMGSAPAPQIHDQPPQLPDASLDIMMRKALQQFPHSTLRWIYTPDSATAYYQFRLYQPGEPGRRFPRTVVSFNHAGDIMNTHDYFTENNGSKLMNMLHPLHNGEMFGLVGRWLVLVSGFIPLILFVTGWMRWRHKQHATRYEAAKKTRL
ncbi:Uncharacterized iron-regulated membrane protein [Methylobacillus rhizosphaerae]|uniref:Uncharacterized iron-regulated membrane protein n=1 Tax=Methylobacillus rhizosphaerae TaxID=551994 RepID=A0A238Y334_9PROT|nr:PepSY-associated TM helix domain-containing protein [Methylobacillus rhizosphaerae]SNR64974.1 Uncharacterized iron-regulated membrane protein [Methylobacillus rhizosphaerae]